MLILKKRLLLFLSIFVFLSFAIWLTKSGNLKAISKTIALESVFTACPFGAKETTTFKFLKPEGYVCASLPTINVVYSKGLFIKNEEESTTDEQVFSYASVKQEEVTETPSVKPVEPVIKPVIMVNLKPKSEDGYLIFENVLAKNTSAMTIDLAAIMKNALGYKISKPSKGPQVLILHTHSTESFNEGGKAEYLTGDSPHSEDNSKNIVAVGLAISKELEAAGVKTIHSTVHHDTPDYNSAYNRSLETAKAMLKKYPTIKIVLDIHRDSIINTQGEKYRPVVKIKEKNAAQIMIICGVGTKELPNTHWKENLKTTVLLNKQMESTYAGLSRPILIRDNRYNSNVAEGAMLIEVGSCGNILEEAIYAGQLTAKALAKVINSKAK